MRIRKEIKQNGWDREAEEYREVQARVIEVFMKENILPHIAIHMMKDLIKSFKEEIKETTGRNTYVAE